MFSERSVRNGTLKWVILQAQSCVLPHRQLQQAGIRETGGTGIYKGIEEFKQVAGVVFVDVRTPEEYQKSHIPGSGLTKSML